MIMYFFKYMYTILLLKIDLPESLSKSLTEVIKAGVTKGRGGQLMPVVLSLLSTSIITMSFFCPVKKYYN